MATISSNTKTKKNGKIFFITLPPLTIDLRTISIIRVMAEKIKKTAIKKKSMHEHRLYFPFIARLHVLYK